ncbi:ECF transporter S component [Clostridium sp. 19966]|uniref:ECF transporter S component n=1 Tax=Clostridium sp. 19966 TaxID=2768166 RepID=UPI0028DF1830|nr:ECF transporter S component [Clostridium sp. 19966]MDT8718665.1 ECF transporter S component [Clostridium sp. 19966]
MKIKRLVTISLLAAFCFVATFIHIDFGRNMVHLGTAALYISAVLVGEDAGWVGAVGLGMFDLLTYSASWAPFTFIIKGLQGLAAGKIAFLNKKEGNSVVQNLIGFIVGAIISLIGYFLVDWLVFYNFGTALTSSLASIITSIIGIIISIVLTTAIKPILKKAKITF